MIASKPLVRHPALASRWRCPIGVAGTMVEIGRSIPAKSFWPGLSRAIWERVVSPPRARVTAGGGGGVGGGRSAACRQSRARGASIASATRCEPPVSATIPCTRGGSARMAIAVEATHEEEEAATEPEQKGETGDPEGTQRALPPADAPAPAASPVPVSSCPCFVLPGHHPAVLPRRHSATLSLSLPLPARGLRKKTIRKSAA